MFYNSITFLMGEQNGALFTHQGFIGQYNACSIGSYRKGVMIISDLEDEMTASQHITSHIAELSDWRGEMLAHVRQLVLEAGPDIREEWKWDTPVWSQKGNVLAFGAFKDHVKLNFFKGVFLDDPEGLFNAGLDAKTTRGIDLHKDDQIDEAALKGLIRAAIVYNLSGGKKK